MCRAIRPYAGPCHKAIRQQAGVVCEWGPLPQGKAVWVRGCAIATRQGRGVCLTAEVVVV